MGWAGSFAKGQNGFFDVLMRGFSMRLVMLGGLIAVAGGWTAYSDAMHQFHGKPSTATLVDHISECTIEYKIVGQDKSKERMACEAAEALQQLAGAKKIKISRDNFASVRFALADGQTQDAKVGEQRLHSQGLRRSDPCHL